MKASIKVSGSYRDASEIHTKVSATWRAVQSGWVKVSGSWQQFYSAVPPPPPFTPFSDDYTQGASGNETVPSGASHLVITAYGRGGDGANSQNFDSVDFDGGGGGGGAKVTTSVAITESDWGTALAYALTGNTSVTGTLAAGAINVQARGGDGGSGGDGIHAGTGGSGGIASGGNVENLNGDNGGDGSGADGSGGYGGAGHDGYGDGGGGAAAGLFNNGAPGGDGHLTFSWT